MRQDLLKIKQFREQRAARAVIHEQRRVEEKAKAQRQAQEQARRFSQFRAEEEIRLFERIKGQKVALRDIEQMNARVAGLREQQSQHDKAALEAGEALEQARLTLQQARSNHALAMREQEKFEQFIAIQQRAEERLQQRKEEQELEEVSEALYRPGRTITNP